MEEKIKQINERYSRMKEHCFKTYLEADEETQKSIVKSLIDSTFDIRAHNEYQEICDKIFLH